MSDNDADWVFEETRPQWRCEDCGEVVDLTIREIVRLIGLKRRTCPRCGSREMVVQGR